jgi:hypothetical protein
MADPVPKVFICYARADNESENPRECWLDRMRVHLKPYEGKAIEVFCDDLVSLGDQWHQRIQAELAEARVAILLVTSNFMASDYIGSSELPVLLKKATQSGSRLKIIPVILSDSAFDEVEFLFPDPKSGPDKIRLSSLQASGSLRKGLYDLPYNQQERMLKEVAKQVAAECRRPLVKPKDQAGSPVPAPDTSTPEKTVPHDPTSLPSGTPRVPRSDTATHPGPPRHEGRVVKSYVGQYRTIASLAGVVAIVVVWGLFGKQEKEEDPSRVGSPSSKKVVKSPSIPFQCFTNSLGMQFVPIEGTKVWFSIWETRWQDYKAFADSTNGLDDSWRDPKIGDVRVTPTPSNPVVNVSWNEAQAFCSWLTTKERKEGLLNSKQSYRLPTDLEWSTAVGLKGEVGETPKDRDEKVPGVYPWGNHWPPTNQVGNFADAAYNKQSHADNWISGYDDGFATTSPVGSFPPLSNGLYDLSGNVWEWCEDLYEGNRIYRVLRGGSWDDISPRFLLSSYRLSDLPGDRNNGIGFRVVLSGGGSGSSGGD